MYSTFWLGNYVSIKEEIIEAPHMLDCTMMGGYCRCICKDCVGEGICLCKKCKCNETTKTV